MYYDDDYFYEESEFDERINELKDSLRNQVKDEIKNKIEELTKRNEELEERQKNLNSLEKEYQDKIRNFEYEKERIISNAKKEIYNANLKQFLDFVFEHQTLYEVKYKSIEQEKCPYCDNNRQIKVKDILGREYTTRCKCYGYKTSYYVYESKCHLYFEKESLSNRFRMILQVNDDGCYINTDIFGFSGEKTIMTDYLYEKFDENNPPKSYYRAYFTSKEEAQKYADYLNRLEDEKSE